MSALADLLDRLTVEGELYEKLPDDSVRCHACGHRCLIREGKRGICQVRFNKGGTLFAPHGYVAALQSDPIEKKPFSHVMPGSNALTFGMLGCDYHCSYCFPGETMVVTNRGPMTLEECFLESDVVEKRPDGEIGISRDLYAVAASGDKRKVKGVFRHAYQGELVCIRPYYLPELKCTPDHKVYATDDTTMEPELIRAEDLTANHYLAIPRRYSFSETQMIDSAKILSNHRTAFLTPWKLSKEDVHYILDESNRGKSSKEIGLALKKDPSHIRHIRSKYQRGKIKYTRKSGVIVEGDTVRFPKEHKPGLPARIKVDEGIARLFGLYCAEGSIVQDKNRPNSFVINFSFSPKEERHALEVAGLLKSYFTINARLVTRTTTLAVSANKSSAGLLFKSLAGAGSSAKRVPEFIFEAHEPIVRAFLDALVDGDGHRFESGKIGITTVSKALAYGVAWLALKLGYLPSIYDAEMTPKGMIQGRAVNRAPHQYSVVWYEDNSIRRKLIETDKYYLVPIKSLSSANYNGFVFNMEVEDEHNYLANFFLVSNCQNWLTSQAMRDPASEVSAQFVREMTPTLMVEYARRAKASVVVSSYNEPLITSEWAVKIFKEAKANGLMCAFVSNGNNTPEAIDYLAPYLSAYKVDLKCMNDKNYRKLGGTLQHTLDGIKRAREAGLWVEVVTLTIPGFNDSNEELWEAARFLADVSPDIPWHVTAFHKDYKMIEPENTDAKTLIRAAEIGREAGLRYVYAGNLPGTVGEYEDTHCPKCSHRLIKRRGYVVQEYHITGEGKCPKCGEAIAGVWTKDPSTVGLYGIGFPVHLY